MKKVNWKVRLRNKKFWLALIPAVLLVVQIISEWFGYELPADVISQEVAGLVNAVFAVLVILGIVNDPTTENLSDSKQVMSYRKPKREVK
ncbi:phage holin [Lentibacillus amyloliquefaciens]|uniref:Holin n=1 Tax=Lentibacillus amyloliquefaciens TaxID=1472767 RepID=A0A0U4DP99_9BACI|nr:phage holin [Lentibacillus amyloliquefaciens]ALX47128.1 holin [Lentibacillus amyloliquefaciens]ALX50478.1 holin [Lentibacillus amyloliquefaciens]